MTFLKNMSIGKRLALGFTGLLALSMLMTGLSIWRLQDVAKATRAMMEIPLAKERMLSDWHSNIDSAIRRTTAIARSSDPSLATFFADEAKASSAKSGVLQKKIEDLLAEPEEKALFAKVSALRKVYLSSRDQVFKLKAAGQIDEANDVFQKVFVPGSANYLVQVEEMLQIQRNHIDETGHVIEHIADSSRSLLLVLAGLLLVFGAVLSWVLTTGITVPLRVAVDAARRVASGDLTTHIEQGSGDETGQLLNALRDMNAALLTIVTEVRTGTEGIATASGEIAAGNQDLSSRTEQQAGSLEETASSMEELTATVKNNADNARQANALASAAAAVAVKGGTVVAEVVGTMDSINASSKKIVDIISVIDGIAFQTNILALNAAVEAARAGEQGRGFAVVASEVRNLAQRSASAAKEIKELIGDSVDKVNLGSKLVSDAGSTMDDIVASVHRVTDIITEITSASNEQSMGIEQINQAIGQMDEMTQQNAALVEQSAAAAQAMQQQADTLSKVVSVFNIGQAGGAVRALTLHAGRPQVSIAQY